MSYENVHKNLTPAARKRGRDASLQIRKERQNARIAQVKLMLLQGLKKSEIAQRLGVSDETIRRDCKTFEESTLPPVADSIIDAVLIVVRDEVAGKLSTLDARQQVQDLIEFAVAHASNVTIIKEDHDV